MNVNITGIYENTIFEDLQLLQTDLSSLVNVVEGLPLQYADLTSFTILSNDYTAYKENSISYITNINSDIDNFNYTTTSLLNKTDFSNLIVSGNSTINSSLNVVGNLYLSGNSIFNGVIYGKTLSPDTSIANQSLNLMSRGNAQVYLIASGKTIMSINYNNTTINSTLNVLGTTILNGATTLFSTLNVVGNIIGSGTALTNLNYNAITNQPDLTVYASNTTISTLTTAVDDQFETTITYIDDKATEQHEYTDQE